MSRLAALALVVACALAAEAEAPALREIAGDSIGTGAAPAIAGIWEFRPGGAIVEIKPSAGNVMIMSVIDSPDYTLAPGAAIAVLEGGAEPGVYDMHLERDSESLTGDAGGRRTRDAIVRVDADGRTLSLRHFARRRSVSFRRWFAAIFHATSLPSDRPADIDGAVRLWPDPFIDVMPL